MAWVGPGLGVEHRGVVQALLVVLLGRRVAAALLREHVDHDRALVVLGGVAERPLEALEVVAVEGAGVAHPERLEEHRRLEHLAEAGHRALEAPGEVIADHGHLAHHLLQAGPLAQVARG